MSHSGSHNTAHIFVVPVTGPEAPRPNGETSPRRTNYEIVLKTQTPAGFISAMVPSLSSQNCSGQFPASLENSTDRFIIDITDL